MRKRPEAESKLVALTYGSRHVDSDEAQLDPGTKNLELHNLIADYFAQVLARGK